MHVRRNGIVVVASCRLLGALSATDIVVPVHR